MNWIYLRINLLIFFGLNIHSASCQRLLQIEDPREVETVRFYEGQKLTFRTKEMGREWQTKIMKNIMVAESVLVFDDGFINISDITHIRQDKPVRTIVGKMLMAFGAGWLLYGGVALVLKLPNVVAKDLIVGVVALTSGFLIQHFSKKTYTMGKNARIRLLDISFPFSVIP